jgi:hypothetical protein
VRTSIDPWRTLGEHATACPSRRLTGAQVRAGAPLRPALIWTATDRGDTLSSNGLPGWYDEDGQEHAAAGWTWRHLETGQRGSAAQPGYGTAYLPLDAADLDGASVIARLREACRAGLHWVAVDIDSAGEHLIDPEAVRLLDHREEIVPADATWSPAVVTAAAGHGWYPALIADGYRVLGDDDVIARFDRATVDQMVVDLIEADTDPRSDPMPGEFAVLGLDRDAPVVSWEHDDGEEDRLVEIDRVYPDADGLFAVGCFLWPWRTNARSLTGSGGIRCRRAPRRGRPAPHQTRPSIPRFGGRCCATSTTWPPPSPTATAGRTGRAGTPNASTGSVSPPPGCTCPASPSGPKTTAWCRRCCAATRPA